MRDPSVFREKLQSLSRANSTRHALYAREVKMYRELRARQQLELQLASPTDRPELLLRHLVERNVFLDAPAAKSVSTTYPYRYEPPTPDMMAEHQQVLLRHIRDLGDLVERDEPLTEDEIVALLSDAPENPAPAAT